MPHWEWHLPQSPTEPWPRRCQVTGPLVYWTFPQSTVQAATRITGSIAWAASTKRAFMSQSGGCKYEIKEFADLESVTFTQASLSPLHRHLCRISLRFCHLFPAFSLREQDKHREHPRASAQKKFTQESGSCPSWQVKRPQTGQDMPG